MIKKNTPFLLIFMLLFTFYSELRAQSTTPRTIKPPEFVNGASAAENPLCRYGHDEDKYTVEFLLSNGVAINNVEFILELSDADGNFTSANRLSSIIVNESAQDFGKTLRFENDNIDSSLLEDINDNGHKIRVRSSDNTIIGEESPEIPIYYLRGDISLRINNAENVFVCDDSALKTILEVKDIKNNIKLDDYEFRWYKYDKNLNKLTEIPGENKSTISIDESFLNADGTARFIAKIYMGPCTKEKSSETKENTSNIITVTKINSSEIKITGDPVRRYCPQDTDKTLKLNKNLKGYVKYKWYKGDKDNKGEALESITTFNYNLPDNNFGGFYRLDVIFGTSCTITTDPVEVINEGSSITTSPLLKDHIKLPLPEEVITIEITTDAPYLPPAAPSEYRWTILNEVKNKKLLNNSVITQEVNEKGDYKIEIFSTKEPCRNVIEHTFVYHEPKSIKLTIGESEGFDCKQIELKKIYGLVVLPSGSEIEVELSEDQKNFFDTEWFIDDTATGNINTKTLEIKSTDVKAKYSLRATLKKPNTHLLFKGIVSNIFEIGSLPENTQITASSTVIKNGEEITLTASDTPGYTYQWYAIIEGKEQLIEDETTNTLIVKKEGQYFVKISSGGCALNSNQITITEGFGISGVIPNIITPNNDGKNDEWVLPAEYNDSEIKVSIYKCGGQLDFEKSDGYNQQWPADSKSNGEEILYFYIIAKKNQPIKRGTITVMR